MRTPRSFLAALLVSLVGPLAAQLVAPAGNSFMAGTTRGFEWDEKKLRLLVCLDRSEFPWGNRAFTIRALRLRRATTVLYGLERHTKTSSIVLSTDGTAPLTINQLQQPVRFDQLHGANRTSVAVLDLPFPCEQTAPTMNYVVEAFRVTYDLGRNAFAVPVDARNLIIEFQVTRNPMEPGKDEPNWPVDAEPIGSLTQPQGSRGGVRQLGETCPPQSATCDGAYRQADVAIGPEGFVPGDSFSIRFDSASPDACGCVSFGSVLLQPVPFPNGCALYVDPAIVFVLESDRRGVMDLFGRVPSSPSLQGTRIGCQFAVLGPFPGGFGTSPGLELTIGTGRSRLEQLAAVYAFADEKSPLPDEGSRHGSVPVLEFVGN
jgi:hypothetical protein